MAHDVTSHVGMKKGGKGAATLEKIVMSHHMSGGEVTHHEFMPNERGKAIAHIGKHMTSAVGPGTAEATTKDEEEGEDTY